LRERGDEAQRYVILVEVEIETKEREPPLRKKKNAALFTRTVRGGRRKERLDAPERRGNTKRRGSLAEGKGKLARTPKREPVPCSQGG